MQALHNLLYSPTLQKPGAHDPYTPRHLRALKLDPLFKPGNRHAWIGAFPPFDCIAVELSHATQYRAAAALHGQFDVIWCIAPDALSDSDWPVILDEALRLIGKSGHIALNIPQNFSETARIKKFLKRKYGFRCTIVDELSLDSGLHSIIAVERDNMAAYAAQNWTIGILASGQRTPVVERMIRSVREGSRMQDSEIIIFGPKIAGLKDRRVRFISEEGRSISPLLNEISKKKNILCAEAKNENLLICHDRYYLADGFFESFDHFGTDFDFATVSQSFEDGQTFPSLGYVGGLALDQLKYIPEDARYVDNAYVNGGFFLAKRHVMADLPLNDMCFWNQAEDAEYATVLHDHGIIPRRNIVARAVTVGLPKKHIAYFRDHATERPVLLSQNRAMLRTAGRYYWRYHDHDVSEAQATLAAQEKLALYLEGPERHDMAAQVVIHTDGKSPVEYRSAKSGWEATTGPETCLWMRHSAGETVPALEIRDAAPREGSEEKTGKTIAEIAVREVRSVWAPVLGFPVGAYPAEMHDGIPLTWLKDSAALTLFNPNSFPVTACLSFDYRHLTPDGTSSIIAPHGAALPLLHNGTGFRLAVRLAPGTTRLDVQATSDRRPAPLDNDPRKLWLALSNYSMELVSDDFLVSTPQQLDQSWFALDNQQPVDAILLPLGDATDSPENFLISIEGQADTPAVAVSANARSTFPTDPTNPTCVAIPLAAAMAEDDDHILLTPAEPEERLVFARLRLSEGVVATSLPDEPLPDSQPDVQTLLTFPDHQFVEACYSIFLKRAADDHGRAHHLARLRRTGDRHAVIFGIAASPEGLAKAVEIDGLRALLDAYRKELKSPLRPLHRFLRARRFRQLARAHAATAAFQDMSSTAQFPAPSEADHILPHERDMGDLSPRARAIFAQLSS